MMTNSVAIILDHERNLRFSWGDYKDLCRILTRLEPGDPPRKVTQGRLLELLLERDMDAITQTLFHGLRWEDRALKAERIDQILGDYMANGGDVMTITNSIAEAFMESGIVPRPANLQTNGASGNESRTPGA
jgi:hypothetical protein